MKRWAYFAAGYAAAAACAIAVYAALGRHGVTAVSDDTFAGIRAGLEREPRGVFGGELGSYLTIEGVSIRWSQGWQGFQVDTLNGKQLEKPVDIKIRNLVLPDGQTRYVLKGYEDGTMYGRPPAEYSAAKEQGQDAEALRKGDQIPWHWDAFFVVLIADKPAGLEIQKYR